MAEPAKAPDATILSMRAEMENWQRKADEMLKAAGGDARAAIIGLLIQAARLEDELDTTRMVVSSGFTRGWHRRQIGRRQQ